MPSAPVSTTAQLARMLFPSGAKLRVLLMLDAYFDDSGTDAESRVAVLAGYLGPAEEWTVLEAEWNAVLRREDLTFYRTADCNHSQGQFDGWPSPRRNALHREMVEIITRRQLVPIGIACKVLTPFASRVPWTWEFEACFVRVIEWVGEYMRKLPAGEQVSMLIERKEEAEATLVAIYNQLMTPENLGEFRPYFAGPPGFRPKEGYPQVQAADVLAYEMYVGSDRHFHPEGGNAHRGSWDALSLHSDRTGGKLLYFEHDS